MTLFDQIITVLILLMAMALAICFIRLFNGPDVPNRTVSFDAIAVHAVGILTLYAILEGSSTLLTVAFVTAVLGFLGTTMLARYLEGSAEQGWQSEQVERPFDTSD